MLNVDPLTFISNRSLNSVKCLVDKRRQLTEEASQYIEDNYEVKIFENFVRINVKVAEAPSYGKSVLEYSPNCTASKDYKAVAEEFQSLII